MRKISYKIALGGIISSLCLVCMFMTGVFPVLYIVLPMIAGIMMMIMNEEVDTKWAFLTYISTSIISIFVTFDKEAALLYILLFGHYPIVKGYIDNLRNLPLRLLIKLLIFNVSFGVETFLAIVLLGSVEMYRQILEKGKWYIVFFVVMINLICFLYDYSLSGVYITYIRKLKPKLRNS